MKETLTEIGSRTAKGGFEIEQLVANYFLNWYKNTIASNWLQQMGYDLSKIDHLIAVQVPTRIKSQDLYKYGLQTNSDYSELQKYKKADVEIQLFIKLKDIIKIETISIKKANTNSNYNQIDKRSVTEYQKMWGFSDKIAKYLKLFTGETKVTCNFNNYKEPNKRVYLTEFSKEIQEQIISFFTKNKYLVVADSIKGRGGLSANWILVCKTNINNEEKEWKLIEINKTINYLCQGNVEISPKGSLSIGKITMQRKGGTPDPTSLQFKFHPLDLFNL